jgi:succinate dehydrogenase / fumarate reductase, membrane anchor subunit
MTTEQRIIEKPKANLETKSWVFMRYSAVLLIPLVFGHLILQDVIVGVHRIDLDYVAMRWASIGWRIYDALLLAFAFAHGVNGIRQVLNDFIHTQRGRKIMHVGLLVFWFIVTAIGAIALIGGVRPIS